MLYELSNISHTKPNCNCLRQKIFNVLISLYDKHIFYAKFYYILVLNISHFEVIYFILE